MTITTAIFDLDGLLADTERWHRRAYQETLRELEVELSEDDYDQHWIRDGKGIADFLAVRRITHLTPADIKPHKAARYAALVAAHAQPMPGAVQLIDHLDGQLRLALATASYRDAARAALDAIGLAGRFETFAAKENVERIKPHPDVFLHVAQTLDVSPDECIVFEDSEKGIRAAHAASMRSIAVPNEHTASHDFSLATRVIKSLEEISIEDIQALD